MFRININSHLNSYLANPTQSISFNIHDFQNQEKRTSKPTK